MAVEFKLPDLGENVEAADVVNVFVSPGDPIEKEQSVLEVETDKASLEVPSDVAGKVGDVLVNVGDNVKVGQAVLRVEPADGEQSSETAAESGQAAESTAMEPRPEEASGEPQATQAAAEEKTEEEKPAEPPAEASPAGEARLPVPAAPAVRQFAREVGVDIEEVQGSGPAERISFDDVKRHARGASRPKAAAPTAATPPLPDFTAEGPVEPERMNNIRRKTVEHMARCWATVPHVTLHAKADMTDLEAARQAHKQRVAEAGGKLTVTAMLLKIAASALKVFPKLNASVDADNEQVLLKKYYNIGLAVDTPNGLVVPVVRDVDKKNLTELAVELGEVSERARQRKLTPDDFSGGTFTLTNLGGLGIDHFSPIVNWPEVAILGFGRAVREPTFKDDGEVEGRLTIPLSLSVDHRLVDGADGARFLRWVTEAIREPMLISLEG